MEKKQKIVEGYIMYDKEEKAYYGENDDLVDNFEDAFIIDSLEVAQEYFLDDADGNEEIHKIKVTYELEKI